METSVYKKNIILFFDTETTGFEHNGVRIPMNSLLQYITQLSFILLDSNTYEIIEIFNSYVNLPKDVKIPEKIKTLTNITEEDCLNGKSAVECLWRFYLAWCICDKISSHNFDFDMTIITNELRRYENYFNKDYINENVPHRGIYQLYHYRDEIYRFKNSSEMYLRRYPKEAICTMIETCDFCDLMLNDKRKWPKLSELYKKLFNEEPPGPLHNALIDTLVGLRCYLKFFEGKIIHSVKFRHLVEQCKTTIS